MTPALRSACLADGPSRLAALAERAYLGDDTARQQWLTRMIDVLDLIRSNRQLAYWQGKWRQAVRPVCVTFLSPATMASLDSYIGIA